MRHYIYINSLVVKSAGVYTRKSKRNGKNLINILVYTLNRMSMNYTIFKDLENSKNASLRKHIEDTVQSAFIGLDYIDYSYIVRIKEDIFHHDLCNRSANSRPSIRQKQFNSIADLLETIQVEDNYAVFKSVRLYEGYVYFHFNEDIAEKLLDTSKGFATCNVDVLLRLKTSNAASVYMFIARYADVIEKGEWGTNSPYTGFSIHTIFNQLCINEVKKDRGSISTQTEIIYRSIKEINDVLNAKLEVESIYEGKSISKLKFITNDNFLDSTDTSNILNIVDSNKITEPENEGDDIHERFVK